MNKSLIRVNVHDSTIGPVGGGGGTSTIIEMPAVPRIGETIFLSEDHDGMDIRAVLWTPYSDEYDVQVRGWSS